MKKGSLILSAVSVLVLSVALLLCGGVGAFAAESDTETALTESYTTDYIPGDASGDGTVNAKDVTLIKRFVTGHAVEMNESAADVNADGDISGKDVTLIRRYLSGYDVELLPAPVPVYKITFKVNGTSHVVEVPQGQIPVFDGSTDKPDDSLGRYTFTGWDREVVPAEKNTTYIAQYKRTEWRRYTLLFRYNGGAETSMQYVREGNTPTPPDIGDFYNTETKTYIFKGWSLPLEPVTAEFFNENKEGTRLIYEAIYEETERLYAVNFTVGGETVYTDHVPYGGTATYRGEAISIPAGYSFIGWEGLTDSTTTDNESHELFFSCFDPIQLEWAYTMGKLSFSSSSTSNDNSGNVLGEASAVLYMALEVRTAPELTYAERFRDRVVESLAHMVSDDGEAPFFDLQPYWCYANLSAAITICRQTPAIWDCLSAKEQEKYDIIMRSFAYVLTLGTADGNSYSTGPGLTGNFGKGWNPNYRLANITPMLFVAKYFGGAAEVNALLHAFDFETAVADFAKYPCFDRAYKRWTTKIVDESGDPIINPSTGLPYPDASYFMENGGAAYIFTDNDRLGYSGVTSGGSGVGVRIDYKYNGFNLDQVDKIMSALLKHTYSGGIVFSDSKYLGTDGIYPQTALDPALIGTSKAYILDGTVSPVEGLPGLMLEFNSGDGGNTVNGVNTSKYNGKNIRSSASYNLHNFVMIAASISALESLGAYDCDSVANSDIFKLMWVGTTDFLYKLEHGYMSYSLGSGYESHEGSGSDGYFAWKAWWNSLYADSNPYNSPKNTLLYEDYSEGTVNATYYGNTTLNNISYSAVNKYGASFLTKDEGKNRYLEARSTGLAGWDGTGTQPTTDLLANYCPSGGLATAMGMHTRVSFCMDLARTEDEVFAFSLRLRAKSSADVISVISVSTDGVVSVPTAGGSLILGTLTEEFQTVRVTLDFAKGTVTAALGSASEKSGRLALPAAATVSTAAEWLKTLTTYVFNWYFSSNNTTVERAVLADNILIYSET